MVMASSRKVVFVAVVLLLLTHQVASLNYISCAIGVYGAGQLAYEVLTSDTSVKEKLSWEWVFKHHTAGYLYYCLPGGKKTT